MKTITRTLLLFVFLALGLAASGQPIATAYGFKGPAKLIRHGGEAQLHCYQELFAGDRVSCGKLGEVRFYVYHAQSFFLAHSKTVVSVGVSGLESVSGPPLEKLEGKLVKAAHHGVQGVGFLRGSAFELQGPIAGQRKAPQSIRWRLIENKAVLKSAEIWISGPAKKGGWNRSEFQPIDHKELGSGTYEYPLPTECLLPDVHYFYRIRLKYVAEGKELEWEMPHVDYWILTPAAELETEGQEKLLTGADLESRHKLAFFYWQEGLLDDCERANQAVTQLDPLNESAIDAIRQIHLLHGVSR